MSGYKNFAVVGAGRLGSFIIDELLKQKASGSVDRVVVLSRSNKNNSLAEKGAEPVVVDYNSLSSIQHAFKGIDVVISTIGGEAVGLQEKLADAAKAAGVKLFIPSEFGDDTSRRTESFWGIKNSQREYVDKIGLPWAIFYTGLFADWIFYDGFLGFDLKNGKAEVGGSGDAPVTWTSRRDIARYVVHVLTSLPPEKLYKRIFKVEGERISINGVLQEYEQRTGKKLTVNYIPIEEVRKKAEVGDFKALLQLAWETDGTFGSEEEMNVDWPEFKPEKVVDALLRSE